MIKNKNNRIMLVIDKRRWLVMFLSIIALCTLIEPAYISATPNIVHQVFRIMKYAVTAAVLAIFVIYRIKVSMLLVWTALFEFSLLLSTILNGSDIAGWARDGAYSVVLLLLMQMIFLVDAELLFRTLSVVLGSYVHINTLTWLLYPKGMYVSSLGYWNCWFLGYDNVAAVIIFLAQIVALHRIAASKQRRFKLWDWSVLISGGVVIFCQMVANAVIAEAVVVLFLLLTRREKLRNLIGRATWITYGMLALFVLIQLFSVQRSGIFALVFLLLGKDMTFSNRTIVWQQAWPEVFSRHLFLGRGIQATEDLVNHFGRYWVVHLHCYYLQVLYEGGLLAFIILVVLLLCAARRFDRKKTEFCDMVLLAGFLGFLVMWQVEASSNLTRYFFILLFLLYNAHEFKPAQDIAETP